MKRWSRSVRERSRTFLVPGGTPSRSRAVLAATALALVIGAGARLQLGGRHAESAEPKDATARPAAASSEWLARATAEIEKGMYEFAQAPDGTWANSNPRNRLHFAYARDGFQVRPAGAGAWTAEFKVAGVLRGDRLSEYGGGTLNADGARASVESDGLVVNYTNDEKGMRQDFVVKSRPEGDGPLGVRLEVKTDLLVRAGGDSVSLEDGEHRQLLRYAGLYAYDADGKTLPSHVAPDGDGAVALLVDDSGARYPVTIDPMAVSAPWSDSPQGVNNAAFGTTVAGIGDINGDTYSDVAVFGLLPTPTVFVYHGSASGLSTTANWSFAEPQTGSGFGTSIASAGDVDNDGFNDLVVGAPTFNLVGPPALPQGRVYIFNGSSGGLPGAATATIDAPNAFDSNFGISVACGGSVDGDLFSDLLVGCPGFGSTFPGEGCVYVFAGSSGGITTTPLVTVAPTGIAGAGLGACVTGVFDVDGDGFSDIAASAPAIGNVLFFLGSATGPSPTTPTTTLGVAVGSGNTAICAAGDVDGDTFADLAIGTPSQLSGIGRVEIFQGTSSGGFSGGSFVVSAPASQTMAFGTSVSFAGDVNADGFGDVVVGAPNFQSGAVNDGAAFMILGSLNGPKVGTWNPTGAGQAGALFGQVVAGVGDVNGDGLSDVMAGAPGMNVAATADGKAFAYHGARENELDPTVDFSAASSAQANSNFGFEVASAGDVNADGVEDVIVTAPFFNNGAVVNTGNVWVFHGTAQGVPAMVPTGGFSSATLQNQSQFGQSAAGVGDVDRDGFDDIIVSTPLFNSAAFFNVGQVEIFQGSATGINTTPIATFTGGIAQQQLGARVAGVGDTNGDGFPDFLVNWTLFQPNGGAPATWTQIPLTVPGNAAPNPNPGVLPIPVKVCGAGDVNRDNFADMVITYNTVLGTLSSAVYHGKVTAIGNINNAVSPGLAYPAGDMNGDGFSDIVVLDSTVPTVKVHWGQPAGTTPAWFWTSGHASFTVSRSRNNVATGDFNGDGCSDIVFRGTTNFLTVLMGHPFLFPNQPRDLAGVPIVYMNPAIQGGNTWGGSLAAVDLDGDGCHDLVTSDDVHLVGVNARQGQANVYFSHGGTLSHAAAVAPLQFNSAGMRISPTTATGTTTPTTVTLNASGAGWAGLALSRVNYSLRSMLNKPPVFPTIPGVFNINASTSAGAFTTGPGPITLTGIPVAPGGGGLTFDWYARREFHRSTGVLQVFSRKMFYPGVAPHLGAFRVK